MAAEAAVFRNIIVASLAGLAFMLAGSAFASGFGTAPEAQAMLEKAVAALKANEDDALLKFSDPMGGFKDRDLYVFAFRTDTGEISAHINPALLGTDIRTLKGPDGEAYGQKIFDAALAAEKEGRIVTVDYRAPKPDEDNFSDKQAFIYKVGVEGVGCGYY